MNLDDKISSLKGIGEKKAKSFEKIGITTIFDLIEYIPRDYENRKILTSFQYMEDGKKYSFKAKILNIKGPNYNSKYMTINLTIKDYSLHPITAIITYLNSPYLIKKINLSDEYIFTGIAKKSGYSLSFINPEINVCSDFISIKPIYSLTNGLKNFDIINALNQVKTMIINYKKPIYENKKLKFSFSEAIYKMHFPQTMQDIDFARQTLSYYEIFDLLFDIKLLKIKNLYTNKDRKYIQISQDEIKKLFNFELTNDQKKAIKDIYSDMDSNSVMNRLLQGDVGSGKTAIAIASIYKAFKSGYQSIFMVPTEVLANQHFENLKNLFGDSICILTSKIKGKSKILKSIELGKKKIIVGTHSLISENVKYNNLALVITDEQHKFGVKQRQKLCEKGESVDVLSMSATPIPRTMSIVLYSDMPISEIREMPKNRKTIQTNYIPNIKIPFMLEWICKNCIENNERVYFIVPSIEDSKTNIYSTDSLYKLILPYFNKYKLNLAKIHSKINQNEIDSIMNDFKTGKISGIVSTTVIEVGIDVKEATIICIFDCDRFGLSTLHQLRGRVGRNDKQSYCFLLTNNSSENVKNRIKIMEKYKNGFDIANKDLELRGSGDLQGTRQHGLLNLKFFDIIQDKDVIFNANADLEKLNILKLAKEIYKDGVSI